MSDTITNKEASRRYRERIKNDPEKYKLFQQRKKLQYKNYIEKIKQNPEKYQIGRAHV